MVSVLFTIASVAADRLKVAFIDRTDPDVTPCRRYGKGTDARERVGVAYETAASIKIPEAVAGPDACYAWHPVRNVPQSCGLCGSNRRNAKSCSSMGHAAQNY